MPKSCVGPKVPKWPLARERNTFSELRLTTIILHRIEKDKQLLVATYTSNKNARVHRIQTNAVRTVDKSCALGRNPVAQGVPTIAANLGIEGTAQLLQMCRFQRKLRVCSVHSSAEAAAFAYSSLAGLHDLLLHSSTSYFIFHALGTEKRNHATKVAAFTRPTSVLHQTANVNPHTLY